MDKNKLTITIMVVLICLTLAVGIYILTSPDKQTAPASNSNTYSISVTENNKATTGELTSNGKIITLNSADMEKYVLVGFNSVYDIMTLKCPETYAITNPKSSTGNQITETKILNEVSIVINKGKQNNLTISCSKN